MSRSRRMPCLPSLVAAQVCVLGAVVTLMQGMAGSPNSLCKQRKGSALSVIEPGYRQQSQGVGRTGQRWKVPAEVGGRRGMSTGAQSLVFLFGLTLCLEEAGEITQEP